MIQIWARSIAVLLTVLAVQLVALPAHSAWHSAQQATAASDGPGIQSDVSCDLCATNRAPQDSAEALSVSTDSLPWIGWLSFQLYLANDSSKVSPFPARAPPFRSS